MTITLPPRVVEATMERDRHGTFYTAYRVRVGNRVGDVISRRYSDFRVLYSVIRNLDASLRPDKKHLPRMTGRKFGRGKSRLVINKRIRKLTQYLLALYALGQTYPTIARVLDLFLQETNDGDEIFAGKISRSGNDFIRSSSAMETYSDEDDSATEDESQDDPDSASHRDTTERRYSLATTDASTVTDYKSTHVGSQSERRNNTHTRRGTSELSVNQRQCATCGAYIAPEHRRENAVVQFCSPHCEQYFLATAKKGFRIGNVGGKRQLFSSQTHQTQRPQKLLSGNRRASDVKSRSVDSLEDVETSLASGGYPADIASQLSHRQSMAESEHYSSGLQSLTPPSVRHRSSFSAPDGPGSAPPTERKKRSSLGYVNIGRKAKDGKSLIQRFKSRKPTNHESNAHDEDPRSITDNYSHMTPIVKNGWLYKRGGHKGGRRSWKRRYFVLRDRSLFYYKMRNSNPVLLGVMHLIVRDGNANNSEIGTEVSRPDKIVSFAEVKTLPATDASNLNYPTSRFRNIPAPCLFVVQTSERDLYLSADTEASRTMWIRSIRELVANFQQRQTVLALSNQQMMSPHGYADASEPVRARRKLQRSVVTLPDILNQGGNASDSNAGVASDASPSPTKLRENYLLARSPSDQHLLQDDSVKSSRSATVHAKDDIGRTTMVSEADVEILRSRGYTVVSTSRASMKAHSVSSIGSSVAPTQFQSPEQHLSQHDSHVPEGDERVYILEPPLSTWEIDDQDIEMVAKVGVGRFGQVYRGRLWGSDVAIKVLMSSQVSEEARVSLAAEIRVLASLRHPNILLYMGACTTPPHLFVVTEFCSRGSLDTLLYDSNFPLSSDSRLNLALHAAQGMCYLHSRRQQIIHRDLKSHNLLLTQDYTVKVADFGVTIVKASQQNNSDTPDMLGKDGKVDVTNDDANEADNNRDDNEKNAGAGSFHGVSGTLQWMAPEVLEGERYNNKVDVYSFGIVLCELVTRTLPFSDMYKRFDFIDAVLEEGATPTIPQWCGPLINSCALVKLMPDDVYAEARYVMGLMENPSVSLKSAAPPSTPIKSTSSEEFQSYENLDLRDLSLQLQRQVQGTVVPLLPDLSEAEELSSASSHSSKPQQKNMKVFNSRMGVRSRRRSTPGSETLAQLTRNIEASPASTPRRTSLKSQLSIPDVSLDDVYDAQTNESIGKTPKRPGPPPPPPLPLAAGNSSGSLLSLRSSSPFVESFQTFFDDDEYTRLFEVTYDHVPPPPSDNTPQSKFRGDTPSNKKSTVLDRVYVATGSLIGKDDSFSQTRNAKRSDSDVTAMGSILAHPEENSDEALQTFTRRVAERIPGAIREWSVFVGELTGVLRLCIEACLNRDPDQRPSFDEIVDLLRAMTQRPSAEVLLQLELPRLREALAYGDLPTRNTAAREISTMTLAACMQVQAAVPWSLTSDATIRLFLMDKRTPRIGFDPRLKSSDRRLICPSTAVAPSMIELQVATPELCSGLAACIRSVDIILRAVSGLPRSCCRQDIRWPTRGTNRGDKFPYNNFATSGTMSELGDVGSLRTIRPSSNGKVLAFGAVLEQLHAEITGTKLSRRLRRQLLEKSVKDRELLEGSLRTLVNCVQALHALLTATQLPLTSLPASFVSRTVHALALIIAGARPMQCWAESAQALHSEGAALPRGISPNDVDFARSASTTFDTPVLKCAAILLGLLWRDCSACRHQIELVVGVTCIAVSVQGIGAYVELAPSLRETLERPTHVFSGKFPSDLAAVKSWLREYSPPSSQSYFVHSFSRNSRSSLSEGTDSCISICFEKCLLNGLNAVELHEDGVLALLPVSLRKRT